jgi:hypothetical protein
MQDGDFFSLYENIWWKIKKIIAILISASMRVESIRMGVVRKKQQQQQTQKAKHYRF